MINTKYSGAVNRPHRLPQHPSSMGAVSYYLYRIFFPTLLIAWILFTFFTPTTFGSKSMLRGHDKGAVVLDKTGTAPYIRELNIAAEGSSKSPSKENRVDAKININHAIIVAGHAVMRLSQLAVADKSEQAWYLLPYQLKQGFPEIIASHIKKGIELSKKDANSLLIFSGGQTRHDVGPTSEAASYYYLAQQKKWMSGDLTSRVYLDEYARDSFENLLFSICRFKEVLGYYPTKITVIGFDFKADRFSSLHRKAIRYPSENFTYVGIKPSKAFDYEKALSGEKYALLSFTNDLYGCNEIALKQKRIERNPFRRTVPYELACPELSDLLSWCGPHLYPRPLPWES